MKKWTKLGYVRPEHSLMEFETSLCQDSTYTTNFEDGGAISGEWK